MPQMLIIADDLSGAADCAIACSVSGLSAAVVFGDLHGKISTDVLSIDADTRNLEPHLAAQQTVALLRKYIGGYAPAKDLLLFKKVDSTLRGNVGAELAAMLELRRGISLSRQRIVAVMAPAFPAGGRTTVEGRQLVYGKPLHESETWQLHAAPCPTRIPTMVQLAGMRPATLPLSLVRSHTDGLRQAMAQLAVAADVLICDAETDDDLRAIATASMVLGRETIWSGSAGLAYHLPLAAGLSGTAYPASPLASGPTLLVIGSPSSISRKQVDVLASSSLATVLTLSTNALLAGAKSPEWSKHASALRATLQDGHDIAVVLEADDPIDTVKGRALTNALGVMMAPLAENIGALVATGGETARSVLQAWGVTGLRMIGELEPGVPFSMTENWNRRLPVLTKAGAFGNPQTLLHCWNFLHHLDRGAPVMYSELKGPL